MRALLAIGGVALATVPVTVLFCRYRISRKKRVSYGTMFVGALITTLFVFAAFSFAFDGWDVFLADYWLRRGAKGGPPLWTLLAFVITASLLPALGVVAHYRRRNETRAA
jgi:hypothetical protein